jgi:hypothetical protein
MTNSNSIDFEPKYSSSELPGKCIKCLAEKELNDCLRELLREENENEITKEKYRKLVAFLKSPESQKLRDESEKYLSDGKQVKIKIDFLNREIEYTMEITNKIT